MNSANWGTQIKYGEYEIIGARENRARLLGDGRFGRTFEAVRIEKSGGADFRKSVALKVLDPGLLANDAKRFQFIQELLALTESKHPNLAQYLRCGEEKGEVFYAIEMCRGGDLAKLVKRFGPLPEKVVALIGSQAAAGLKEIHQRHRLVHRNLKPSNIVLAEELGADLTSHHLAYRLEQQESLCRVVDFGLVTFALNAEDSPQLFAGSTLYASPEQIREQPLDGRCDIYSLGMILWHLLQGNGPFLDATGNEITDEAEAKGRQLCDEEHERHLPSHSSPDFRGILARMVAKRPEQRFSSAGELQGRLEEYLTTTVTSGAYGKSLRCEDALLTRLSEPLESVYDLESRISSRGTHNSYAAREKLTGRRVKVSVVSNVDEGGGAEQAEALAARLCKFAAVSREAGRPEALLPIQAIVWAADLLAYTEELVPYVGLSELLKARNFSKRPVGFAEAVSILRPMAEALDFLLQHGQEAISIPCEEVWLTGDFAGALAANAPLPTTPLQEWDGLQVRFSMVYLPQQAQEDLPDASGSTIGRTMSGSLQMSAADSHPVPVFARLIYRILNGSEVAAAVQFAPYAFVPAVTLSYASNNLIRDVISRQRPWIDAMTLLRDLCAKEGVMLRAGNTAAVARVVSLGNVQSPFAPPGVTQKLTAEQWTPGAEFICAESGRKVLLPMELPVDADPPSSKAEIVRAAQSRASIESESRKAAADESQKAGASHSAGATTNGRWLNADQVGVSRKAGQFAEPAAERSEPPRKKTPVVPPRKVLPPPLNLQAKPRPDNSARRHTSKKPLIWIFLLLLGAGAGGWYFLSPTSFQVPESTSAGGSNSTAEHVSGSLPEARAISKSAEPVRVVSSTKPATQSPRNDVRATAVATPAEKKAATPIATAAKSAAKPLVDLAEINQALKKNPNNAAALLALGDYALAHNDLARAKENYTRAMEAAPDDPQPLARRARIWALSGSFPEAINDYRAAIKLDGRNVDALIGLGDVSMTARDYQHAASLFSEALRVDPESTEAMLGRARSFRRLQAFDKAEADYERYVTRKTDDPRALSEFAWLLATASNPSFRDGAKAEKYGALANKLTQWRDSDCLDTYAAALAESGKFEEAVKCENEAVTCAAQKKDAYRNELEGRMNLYASRKPYRVGVR